MSDFESKMKELSSPLVANFENQIKSTGNWVEKNPILSTMLGLGSIALLGKGRAFQRIATSMQQMIPNFYGQGVGKLGKMGAFSNEFFRGVKPATQQVFNQKLTRAYKKYGFGAGQKKDLDRIFKGYSMVLRDRNSWINKNMGVWRDSKGVLQNPKLTEEAAKQITFLGKQELGIMHNAFAQQVKIHGLAKAKKMDLYNLIKHEANYTKYGVGGAGKMTKLFKDMGIEDAEVGKIALKKWNQGLVPKLKGVHKGSKSINIANFRHSAMQKSAIDAQFSSQAKIAFLAHEAGLMKKGAHLEKLGRFFQKRGYGKLVDSSKNHMVLEGKTYKVSLHKTKQGSTLVNFSPSRKSNYHWGGFNGNLVFNETKRKGQVGIFGTDVYDIEIMKLKGDKWANFRKTPLLNVQNVKYKKVPIINPDKVPKNWVQRSPRKETVYNKKLFNDDKLNAQLDDIVDTGKYGIAETQAFSPYAKERFGMLSRPTKGRLKGGAIEDARGPMSAYSRHSVKFNKAVEDYYRLYTESMKRPLNPLEKAQFIASRTALGIGGTAIAGSALYGAGKALEPAARWSYDKSKEARDFAYERIKDFLSSEEEV